MFVDNTLDSQCLPLEYQWVNYGERKNSYSCFVLQELDLSTGSEVSSKTYITLKPATLTRKKRLLIFIPDVNVL